MMLNRLAPPAPTALVLLASLVNAWIYPPIIGHDFDFKAVYPSGLELSTLHPPTDILPPEEIPLTQPILTLINPDSAAEASRYIAFLEITSIPTIEMLDDELYHFPWTKTNLTMLSNGTLVSNDDSTIMTYNDEIESGEVRNGTMHIWKQTPELNAWITDEDSSPIAMPIWFTLARVWRNITDDVSKDFPRANIDFKVQNLNGERRCDVDENGASISGIEVGATTCVSSTATTKAAIETRTSVAGATTSGSTEGSTVPSVTGSASPAQATVTNTAARGLRASPFCWPAIAFFILVHVFASLSI